MDCLNCHFGTGRPTGRGWRGGLCASCGLQAEAAMHARAQVRRTTVCPAPPHSLGRLVVRLLFLCVAAVAGCSNFHEVTPGVLYRSGQVSRGNLDRIIEKHRIRTVINLRGASPRSRWYREEMDLVRRQDIAHLDIRLSATRYVQPRNLDRIVKMGVLARKPVLVHCQGGADRTGLFCAAWKFRVEHTTMVDASRQLGPKYGHMPLLRKETAAMDSSFRDYARWLTDSLPRQPAAMPCPGS